jgi:PAS domain S-box-containing protein
MGKGMKRKGVSKTTAKKQPRSQPRKKSPRTIGVDRLEKLQNQLREAQETLDAIRNGEVDAVVVSGAHGNQVYSLAGAEQPYRVFVEQMQEGAVTVSTDSVILFCNRRLAEMLKAPMERVIGAALSSYFHGDAWRHISKVFSAGVGVVKYESVLTCADGGSLPVHLTANRLPMDGQDVMCLVISDLTSQKHESQLRLDKEVAEKANATKDAFLAALSHELRTPLTPVLVLTQELEKDLELPERVRDGMTTIRRNIELEARLIDDLLDLTRVARGKMELHLEALDFHELLRQAVEICRSESDAKDQIIQLRLNATQTRIQADGVRINQAIWNLIRNAVKFTPPGGTIVLKTSNPGRNGELMLEVADKGIGFAPEMSSRLFEAFEQGDRQITRQFGGLGLGLAITKSIVSAHDGKVSAYSAGPGKGATFRMELPANINANAAADAGPGVPSPVKVREGLKVLLVEDHLDTRKSMEFLLARYKYVVKSAGSAEEALALAEQHPFDLVISDLGLPDASGLELMKQLRDRFGLKGIGVSGYGMEEDIALSHAAGFTHHLTKPITMDRLRTAIAEAVN